MSFWDLSHLDDSALLSRLGVLIATERRFTVALLAHLAEVEERRLYAPAGYPSMFAYCVGALRFSESTALKRVYAARAARRLPQLYGEVASGRIHLSGLAVIASHLNEENYDRVLALIAHQTVERIREIAATLAPRPDVPTRITSLEPPPTLELAAPTTVSFQKELDSNPVAVDSGTHSLLQLTPPPRVIPIAPERYAFQVTLSGETRELMRRAQDALGRAVAAHDYDALLREAFDALITQQMRRRYALTDAPRAGSSLGDGRYIPAHVKRAVVERDGDRCTFVSEDGKRCECRRDLEYDHVRPFSSSSLATLENLRLRCHAHNQWTAEQEFGREFMRRKREEKAHGPGA